MLAAALILSPARAQAPVHRGNTPIVIPGYRIQKPPTIDGIVDDAEWSRVPSVKGLVDAQTGDPAPEPAQFWVAYDDRYDPTAQNSPLYYRIAFPLVAGRTYDWLDRQ